MIILFLQLLISFLIIFERLQERFPNPGGTVIVRSLSLSSFASSSEYGPHRLPISLVCRRLQRLLHLADPPGRGPRARPSSSATPVRQTQRATTAAAGAETQPHTGYLPHLAAPLCGLFASATAPDIILCQTVGLEKDTALLTTNSPTVILSPIPNIEPCTC